MKLDDDATEFAWITIEKVGDYDFIDGIAGEIKEVDEILMRRFGAPAGEAGKNT